MTDRRGEFMADAIGASLKFGRRVEGPEFPTEEVLGEQVGDVLE